MRYYPWGSRRRERSGGGSQTRPYKTNPAGILSCAGASWEPQNVSLEQCMDISFENRPPCMLQTPETRLIDYGILLMYS